MTEYVLLSKHPSSEANLWNELPGVVKASSARRALASANVEAGEWLAIPARSWKPLTVKVEQTTKITIG